MIQKLQLKGLNTPVQDEIFTHYSSQQNKEQVFVNYVSLSHSDIESMKLREERIRKVPV